MIFKSRQVNLDPKPWVDESGGRHRWLAGVVFNMGYDPRPEFEPTRDPEPWVNVFGNRVRTPGRTDDGEFTYDPRREQFDTPVNRVLVEFRMGWSHDPTYGAANWLESLDDPTWQVESVRNAAPEEIDHARRVLARLANWKEQADG